MAAQVRQTLIRAEYRRHRAIYDRWEKWFPVGATVVVIVGLILRIAF